MKLVTFEVKTQVGPFQRLGALEKNHVVDLNFALARLYTDKGKAAAARLADALIPPCMLSFLDGGDDSLKAAREALTLRSGAEGPRGETIFHKPGAVRLLAPVPRPRSLRDFFAFEEHARQGAARRKERLQPEWYQQPVYYKGNPREVYGPGAVLPWPSYTRKFDFEFEIAAVVGKKGRDLSPRQAASCFAGFTILNDCSARDIQRNEMVCRMGPAKAKDFANAMGPYLLTSDELKEPEGLEMTLKVNGKVWSTGSSSLRYWRFPLMLSHVSQSETVYPGDVLGSGTYFKGCGLDLDRWVKPGDKIEMTVDKLGTLSNVVGKPKGAVHLVYGSNRQAR